MPHEVVRRPVRSDRNYAIVNRNTGKVVGRSRTRGQAQVSAGIRDKAHKKK